MAKYQNLLVAIDPDQDDQPALRRAVYPGSTARGPY